MFIRGNKRAQTTAEYAIIVALVVGAVVAMQVYVRRGLQGKVKDVVDYTGAGGTVGGSSFSFSGDQYEPDSLASSASSTQNATQSEKLQASGAVDRNATTTTTGTRSQTLN